MGWIVAICISVILAYGLAMLHRKVSARNRLTRLKQIEDRMRVGYRLAERKPESNLPPRPPLRKKKR